MKMVCLLSEGLDESIKKINFNFLLENKCVCF